MADNISLDQSVLTLICQLVFAEDRTLARLVGETLFHDLVLNLGEEEDAGTGICNGMG